MKILIVGGSSFIGKNVLLKLQKEHDVIATYYKDEKFLDFLEENRLNKVLSFRCDLTDINEVRNMFKRIGKPIDVVLYLASTKDMSGSVMNPLADLEINARGMVNFLECFRGRRLIFFSSGAVYHDLKGDVSPGRKLSPKLPFAITKLAAEHYIKFYQKRRKTFDDYIIVRFFGAYGPYEHKRKIYTKLIEAFHFRDEDSFTVRGDGENLIDAMYVDDAVTGVLKMIESKKSNLTVDFCKGNPLTINQLVREVAKVLGKKFLQIEHIGETEEHIDFRASPDMFEKEFRFRPKINLETGIKRFVDFMEEERE